MTQELSTLLIENSLYQDEAAKQELITKSPQKVKDAFWINTLGLFAIQKDHGDRLASRKYFADISKTRIKDIPVDVNDMAAATKMAYDAGFLNDSFTYEFTKFLFIFKSKPSMVIDQEKLRTLFKKVQYSKIIPSPKLKTITEKYLKGEADIDHILFPYFYFARQQKYFDDFQLYCRMFYKTITKQAIKVSQEERSGKNIDKHLSGPDTVSSKVIAVQSAATQSVVVSPTINPPAVAKPSPIPAKKTWTWDNFNFFDEFATNPNKSDYVAFFFSALSVPSNIGLLMKNQEKNDKTNIHKFFSHVLTNYMDIFDIIKIPVTPQADFFSVISNWKIGTIAVSDKQAMDLTAEFMRHADKAGYPITFWGLEDKSGNLNQRLQTAFWNSGYGPSHFVYYNANSTPETKERAAVAEYLRTKNNGLLISTPSYLLSYFKKYQKDGDTSYTDKLIVALTWFLNNKSALDYKYNGDSGTGDKYTTMILDAYNSSMTTAKNAAEKVIEEILNEQTYYSLYKDKIPQDIFDAVKKKISAIDQGDKVYNKIKDSNYERINLTSSEMAYVYYNSLEKFKNDYKFVATITAYIMVDAKSPYFKANKDWILQYLVFNSSSGDFFTFLVDRYDSFSYFSSKNPFFVEFVHTALLRQGMLQIWGQMNMDRLGAGQNITPFPGTTGKGFGGWTQFLLGKFNEAKLTISSKSLRDLKRDKDIRVGEIKKASSVGLTDASANSMYRDMFRKMLLSDPTKDVLGDFKAFLILEATFNGNSSYNPEFKGSGSSVAIFAKVFKEKYSIAEVSELFTMNMEYGPFGGGYGSGSTGSIVGEITQDSQSFVNFITTNSEEFMDNIDKIKIDPGQKRRVLTIAVNAGSDASQEAFNKFVSFMKERLDEDLFNTAIDRNMYDRAYFKLVAGGFMEPKDMNYRPYELQQFASFCKDKNGKINNPEELIRIYNLKNVAGPGGLGDAFYRIENLLDSLSIREISDGIMSNEKTTDKQKEALLESLFSSISMGRKGNDRKNAIATRVISDQCIKESLLESNKKSAIPILVPLTGENLLEIFKFNNFEVELPDNLKIGKKNTITQAYKKAKTWTPNIPDLLVSKIEDTQENLDRKGVEYSKYYNDQHGDQGIVFLESFDVKLEEFPELKEFMTQNPTPTIIPAFHGTGSVAASMILRFGFKVVKKSMGGVQVVGKMLGDGIYFSNIVSKSIQYLGDQGYGRQIGTVGYLFEMDAYIGKKGIHHNSAGLNNDGIKSPEWCVFDGRAQLVIKKAHKVKMVHGQTIRDLKKQYPSAINEDRFFPNFAKFLKEERGNSILKNKTTFIFYSGLIPDASGNLIEFDDWVSQNKSSKISYAPGQYGPEITIQGSSEVPFYHIPNSVEFVNSDPEGLYTLFKKLTK